MLVYVCVVAVIMARSTAEGGLLMTETSFRPIDLYQMFGNKSHLGPQTLTTLSFIDAIFTRDQRGLILTGFLDSLKISDEVGRGDLVDHPYRLLVVAVSSVSLRSIRVLDHDCFLVPCTYCMARKISGDAIRWSEIISKDSTVFLGNGLWRIQHGSSMDCN